MSGIFNSEIFNSVIFNTGDAGAVVVPDVVKTGTGGIDPERKRRLHLPVKPTGLVERPAKEGRKEVADRVDETRGIQAEIAARLAKEFSEETAALEARLPVAEMSLAQVEREIGVLLRKQMRTEEDELLLLLLMVAAAA